MGTAPSTPKPRAPETDSTQLTDRQRKVLDAI